MRKKVFLMGSLIALMLIFASSTAFAANLQLSADEAHSIKNEIASGRPIKDVLKEHNITMGQVRSALAGMKAEGFHGKSLHKLSNTQIATLAEKLGIDAGTLESEIDSGKNLPEILKDYGITREQLKETFSEWRNARPHPDADHGISSKHLKRKAKKG